MRRRGENSSVRLPPNRPHKIKQRVSTKFNKEKLHEACVLFCAQSTSSTTRMNPCPSPKSSVCFLPLLPSIFVLFVELEASQIDAFLPQESQICLQSFYMRSSHLSLMCRCHSFVYHPSLMVPSMRGSLLPFPSIFAIGKLKLRVFVLNPLASVQFLPACHEGTDQLHMIGRSYGKPGPSSLVAELCTFVCHPIIHFGADVLH